VINAGGVISVAGEVMGYGADEARARAAKIADTLRDVFGEADAQGVSPALTADVLAERRVRSAERTFGGPGGSR